MTAAASAFALILVACGDNETPTCGNWEAGGLVVIDEDVYWTDDNAGDTSTGDPGGFVWRQPVSGGAKTKLATLTGYPDRMTHDATALYVAGGCGGGVWKVPLDGSPATMLAQVTDDECIHGIAVDQASVYFTNGGVQRTPLDGGGVEQLAAPQQGGYGCADDIVVGADHAYWASRCYNTLSSVLLAGGPVTAKAIQRRRSAPMAIEPWPVTTRVSSGPVTGSSRRCLSPAARSRRSR